MGSFDGLHIGLSALRAQQTLQEIIGHNVANVNTAGFSRRDAQLTTLPPDSPGGLSPAGTGVSVTAIRRSASQLINNQIQREGGALSYWESLRDSTGEIERLFQEPGAYGTQGLLDDFWGAWRDLSIDATSSASRDNIIQMATTLTTALQRTSKGVTDAVTQLNDQVEAYAGDINKLSSQIADLNRQIVLATGNNDPANDLRDRRDLVVENLSKLVQVQVAENTDGSFGVSVGGHVLVGGKGATEVAVGLDADRYRMLVWSDDNTVVNGGQGAVAAATDMRSWALHTVLPDLDKIASSLITSVNALHESAYTADGRTGISFFTGQSAADIAVSDTVANDSTAIAVAAGPDSPGDGSVGLQIAGLQRTPVGDLNDTIDGTYAALAAGVGLTVNRANSMATQQDNLMQFLNGKREDLAGVSLDEEAVKMLGSQKAYEAAARIVTAVDEMLDTLINRTGLVGR